MTQYNVIYKDKRTPNEIIEAYNHWRKDGVDYFDFGPLGIRTRTNVLMVEILS